MGALDSVFPGLAKTLLVSLGATATYTRESPGAYDPLTGDHTGPFTFTWSVTISPPEPYTTGQIGVAGGSVLVGDLRVYLAASGLLFVPTPATDYLTVGSDKLRIVAVREVRSGNSVAMYELQARRA